MNITINFDIITDIDQAVVKYAEEIFQRQFNYYNYDNDYPVKRFVHVNKMKTNYRIEVGETSKDTGNDISRSVHTFVKIETGDILKAGGWKAPAKNGVRGNVKNDTYPINENGTIIYLR